MRLFEARPNRRPYSARAPLGELPVHRLPRRKLLWQVMPSTPTSHLIDNRFQYDPSRMSIGPSSTLVRWQQWFQPPPHHIGHILGHSRVADHGCGRCRQHRRRCRFRTYLCTSSIVVEARPGLMAPPPPRPAQHCRNLLLKRQRQMPEQAPDLRTTQADWRPRWALKRAKLLGPAPFCRPFFGAVSAPIS